MRGRRFINLLGGRALNLTGSSFPANSAIGTVVGLLSVSSGSGFTFSLTSNPGSLFSISGNQLQVNNGSIGAGSYPVTVQASNGTGLIVTQSFVLTATVAAQSEPIPVVL